MAIISVSATDTGRETVHWAVPADPQLNKSNIPRGIRRYGGSLPIAALGAGDETNAVITLQFPSAFMYLSKSISCQFRSDDITSEFENLGMLMYQPAGLTTLGNAKHYALESPGQAFFAAANSTQIYHPIGDWRHWTDGPAGDVITLRLTDMSGDASTAGDVAWTAEFWEYDVEQCLNWQVNTPMHVANF